MRGACGVERGLGKVRQCCCAAFVGSVAFQGEISGKGRRRVLSTRRRRSRYSRPGVSSVLIISVGLGLAWTWMKEGLDFVFRP